MPAFKVTVKGDPQKIADHLIETHGQPSLESVEVDGDGTIRMEERWAIYDEWSDEWGPITFVRTTTRPGA